MKSMNRIFLSAVFLLSAVAVNYAQTDEKANQILKDLSAKTNKLTTIQLDFTFTLLNKDRGLNETTNGSLTVKGDKYKVILDDQEIYCDGQKIYTYKPNANEVQVINVSELDANAITPKTLFTIYESGFKSKVYSDKTESGKNIVEIDLYPLNPKEKDFTIVRLEINKTDMEMRKATVKARNGTIYVYKVKDLKSNATIDDSTFVFDPSKYPGITVIE